MLTLLSYNAITRELAKICYAELRLERGMIQTDECRIRLHLQICLQILHIFTHDIIKPKRNRLQTLGVSRF